MWISGRTHPVNRRDSEDTENPETSQHEDPLFDPDHHFGHHIMVLYTLNNFCLNVVLLM